MSVGSVKMYRQHSLTIKNPFGMAPNTGFDKPSVLLVAKPQNSPFF